MNKWTKFPLIFGIIFGIVGTVIDFHVRILKIPDHNTIANTGALGNINNITSIFSLEGTINGLIIGIILGLIIAIFVKSKSQSAAPVQAQTKI